MDAHSVAEATIRGSASMFGRQIFQIAFATAGGVVLARNLSPSDFGIFGISAMLLTIIGAMSNAGLGAALVQQHDEPTRDELASIFSLQLGLSLLGTVVICALSGPVAHAMHLPPGAPWFFRALSLVLPLSAFFTMSNILLERHLRFEKLALIDVIASAVYYSTAVTFVLTMGGYWSFAIGVFASIGVRCLLSFVFAPWTIRIRWPSGMSASVRFGVLYQAGTVTSMIRDSVIQFVPGLLLGPQAIGYLMWALALPLQISGVFSSIVGQVSFPSLSRIRDRDQMRSFFMSGLRWLLLGNCLALAVLVAAAHGLVEVVYTVTWLPALPAVYLFAIRMLMVSVTGLGSAGLNASGQVSRTLRIQTGWTIADVALATIGGLVYGFVGIAAGLAISSLLPCVWFIIALGLDRRRLLHDVSVALASAALAITAGKIVALPLDGIAALVSTIAVTGAVYIVSALVLGGRSLVADLATGLRIAGITSSVESLVRRPWLLKGGKT
jgi:O-antigen/teichoic acid export membrane protein